MLEIINELKASIKEVGLDDKKRFIETLNAKSALLWKQDYPVAIVHDKKRIKEERVIKLFEKQGLLDEGGYTPASYSSEKIAFIASETPLYIKLVDVMCMSEEDTMPMAFAPKRPHDYWKKVEDPGAFQAVIELSNYDGNKDICQIESELRDIMRSSKEIPSVKEIGFVWIATVPKTMDLSKLLKHYFIENYVTIQQEVQMIYIGWSDTLKVVNMRYFVCPPK